MMRMAPWGLGFLVFILTFYFSWFENTWLTTLFRSMMGFIFFCLIGFILRYFLTSSIFARVESGVAAPVPGGTTTQDKQVESVEDGVFQSLSLDALHTNQETERIAQVLRTLTNEDREG